VSVPAHLDQASVEAVARRVVHLLHIEGAVSELIDVAEVARRFSVSRDYVYAHAYELGVIRLGNGSRARLRFDPVTVRERLTQLAVRDAGESQRGKRRPVRHTPSVDLLPIKGELP
jgi:hypothetical protein